MNLLILSEKESDLSAVLKSCNINVEMMNQTEALNVDVSVYDAYCILMPGKMMDARLRNKIEKENSKGKRVFTEAIGSFLDIYTEQPKNTSHSRLVYIGGEDGEEIEGLTIGDLLDEQSNLMEKPYFMYDDTIPLLVYRDYIVAHARVNMSREEILNGASHGMWLCKNKTVLMTDFRLQNFNKARFSPRDNWIKLITYIVEWLTGNKPEKMPESIVSYGVDEDLSNPEIFEKCRKNAIEKGVNWLKGFLVDNGEGGIREGLHHNIDPEGNQKLLTYVRTDCTGEASGAFKMYSSLYGCEKCKEIGNNLEEFVYDPMVEKGGLFDGMMHWTEEAWGVCYQDDVARAILPTLYDCVLFGNDKHFDTVKSCLDFLVKTTAKDGTREFRTDRINLNEAVMQNLSSAEHGCRSAHYNAYYSAALLLTYKYCKEERYLQFGKKGLETLMEMYPNTIREQSETEEMCRLVLPLAILYDVTGEEKHKDMLYRVVNDLQKLRHPFGGYKEWDTDYKAMRNRNSVNDECSILTENGDPVADLLYSCNFLPMGFAYAYMATGDEWFNELWEGIVKFFIRTQIKSKNTLTNGSWCRAFDMDLREAYAAPHDSGWATYSSETGWICSEILMGMMFPEIVKKSKNK